MVTTRPPKTIVKPTALGPVANTDTKLLIYGLFQKRRVLAQDGSAFACLLASTLGCRPQKRRSQLAARCLCCLLLVMCTHPFAKKELTLARGEPCAPILCARMNK